MASFPTEILHKVPNSNGNDVFLFALDLLLYPFWERGGLFQRGVAK